jgi:hypothetical protein
LRRSKVRQILRRRREEREEKGREILDSLAQIKARLRGLGYQAASADYIGRLHLPKEVRWFLRELGYRTISDLEESCLSGTGIFAERRVESEFVIRVRAEVIQALIEHRENRLRIIRELAAKN